MQSSRAGYAGSNQRDRRCTSRWRPEQERPRRVRPARASAASSGVRSAGNDVSSADSPGFVSSALKRVATRGARGRQDGRGDGDLKGHVGPSARRGRERGPVPRRARAAAAARPLCPYYRSACPAGDSVGLRAASRLTKTGEARRRFRGARGDTAGYTACSRTAARKRLRHTGTVAIVRWTAMFSSVVVVAALVVAFAPAVAARDDARADRKNRSSSASRSRRTACGTKRLYRWQKAVELDPTYAAAWNNLAIAYEHEGKFDRGEEGLREGRCSWIRRT